MLPILQRRFRALENSKAAMLAQLRGIPQDRLRDRPAEGKWSAAELLSHITRVESAILFAVRQKMQENQSDPVSMKDRVSSLLVRNVMRMPLRVKMPAEVPAIQPEENADVAAVLSEWEYAREQWRDLLEHARGSQLKDRVFTHPKMGRFTLPETVLFLRLHHDHHKAQLARITASLSAFNKAVPA